MDIMGDSEVKEAGKRFVNALDYYSGTVKQKAGEVVRKLENSRGFLLERGQATKLIQERHIELLRRIKNDGVVTPTMMENLIQEMQMNLITDDHLSELESHKVPNDLKSRVRPATSASTSSRPKYQRRKDTDSQHIQAQVQQPLINPQAQDETNTSLAVNKPMTTALSAHSMELVTLGTTGVSFKLVRSSSVPTSATYEVMEMDGSQKQLTEAEFLGTLIIDSDANQLQPEHEESGQ